MECRDEAAERRAEMARSQLKGSWLKRARFTWPQLQRALAPARAILVAWPVGLAAAGVVLYLCYLAISRTEEVTSDGASIALQAWDMLRTVTRCCVAGRPPT